MSLRLNNLGVSLLELTVVLGVSSLISLGFMRLVSTQQKTLSGTKGRVEENLLINQIAGILRKDVNCQRTIIDAGINLGSPIPSIIEVNPNTGGVGRQFDVGSVYGGGTVEIVSMDLVAGPQFNTATDDAGEAEILINLKRVSGGEKSFGATTAAGLEGKTYKISLQVQTDEPLTGNPNEVVSCSTSLSGLSNDVQANSCQAMGGIWDIPTSTCAFPCNLAAPSDTAILTSDCLLNTDYGGLVNQMDPLFINAAGGDTVIASPITIQGHFTNNNNLGSALILLPPGSSVEVSSLAIGGGPGNINWVGHSPVVTQNLLFQSLTEADKESVLAAMVGNTSSMTATDTVVDQSRQALSVVSAPCAITEAITDISYNSSNGQFSYTCGSAGTATCPPASEFCSGITFTGGSCSVTGTRNCCPSAAEVCSGETYVNASLGCNVTGTRSCLGSGKVYRSFPETRLRAGAFSTNPSCLSSYVVVGPYGAWTSGLTCATFCVGGVQIGVGAGICRTNALVSNADCTSLTCYEQVRPVNCECDS